ncbi:hypothetical protein [Streptomyces sp. NPDC102360]|uniref:hypothetical protein n=1 Tax=Streptomyces sp. NPDC102360 TaxID=3366160 RepID=UPI00382C899A
MTATPSPAHVPVTSASGAAVERIRPLRAVMAAVMVLGPLLFITASLMSPYDMTEDKLSKLVGDIAANEGQEKAASWVWMAFGFVMIAATLLVCVYVMARSPKLGLTGLLLLAGGVTAASVTPSYDLITLAGLDKGVDQDTIVQILKGTDGLPMLMAVGIWFIGGIVLGSVVLGIGLLRSRSVPAWAAWVLIAAMPVNVAGWILGVTVLAYAGFALLAVAFGVLALDVARNGTGWVRAVS